MMVSSTSQQPPCNFRLTLALQFPKHLITRVNLLALLAVPALVSCAACGNAGDLKLSQAAVYWHVTTACARLQKSGLTGMEVEGGRIECFADSSNQSYQWCIAAIENILGQCAGSTSG